MSSFDHYGHSIPAFDDRLAAIWKRGIRFVWQSAIAFALAVLSAIAIGAAVTDNAFAQIVVTGLAAIALWVPFVLLIMATGRLFQRRQRSAQAASNAYIPAAVGGQSWRRLTSAAPRRAERIAVLERSIGRSRGALGKSELDPDALDLCVLIDRRLPELIDRELDDLPPDDTNRNRRIDELVDLIEQFARHCSRKGAGDESLPRYESEVLRRRFEERLSAPFAGLPRTEPSDPDRI